ncbi:MAG: DUF542 domain-containing protein [Halofilum sp. (in: g-proteobacteria)]|nr:DUF542 domain-containing protein [Halofilum sp. (in: g-proteobacteria)]
MSIMISATPLKERTVGEIAATVPGATTVFRRHRLDFCCGGDVPLAEAARGRGIDVETVADELARLHATDKPEYPRETDALIDHILGHFHEDAPDATCPTPSIAGPALKVEAVHSEHPAVPRGLAEALEAINRHLDEHMRKEEEELFPAMRGAVGQSAQRLLADLVHEHDEHGRLLYRIEAITDNFSPPQGACRTWQALYTGAAQFVDDVMEHVHLENNVLFPRFQ